MGIISTIVALIKAVPVLERLFLALAKEYKEKVASERYQDKLDFIDSAVDRYHRIGLSDSKAKQREGTDGASPVSRCCKSGPSVDKGRAKKGGRARVQNRKKMKSYAPSKKKKGGKKKSL
jgi:hypothetical protein